MGGQLARLTPAPFTVCLDDVRIDDPQYVEVPEPVPPPIPDVLVNQIGYFPALAKIATVKNPNAVPWELLNARARSWPRGRRFRSAFDAASGDSRLTSPTSPRTPRRAAATRCGSARTSATRSTSATTSYAKMKYDALAFFYQQRSGIPIEMPYAGDPQWVRAGAGTSASSRTTATTACRAMPAPAASTRWTSAAAGTTPATTANTSSTPGSRCGRCSTGGSAASRSAARPTSPTGR